MTEGVSTAAAKSTNWKEKARKQVPIIERGLVKFQELLNCEVFV